MTFITLIATYDIALLFDEHTDELIVTKPYYGKTKVLRFKAAGNILGTDLAAGTVTRSNLAVGVLE